MPKKETYVTVQASIIKKLDLRKRLGAKTVAQNGRIPKIMSQLRKDKKITTKDNATEALKDVGKWIESHFEEFKKIYDKQ